jgi:peptidoglycan/LPS O-acetylase OafA/YrhL
MSSSVRRPPLPALTGLRAVAALWVVLFHYRSELLTLQPGLAPLDAFMKAGYLGVDLFFPLSGFVLAYTYADAMGAFRWQDTAHFIRNRFARVWPVHVVTLHADLVLALFAGTLGVAADGLRRTLPAYVENLGMVHYWVSDRPSFNSPAWSISAEWFAYLCAPVLFVLVARLRRAGSALVLAALAYAAMLAVFATMALPNGNLDHMFYVRILGEFVGGMLLCLAWVRGGAHLGRFVVVLPLTLVVLALVPAAAGGHYWAAPALGLGVAALAASRGRVAQALSVPWLVAAGEASFALYMTHVLLQPVVRWATGWAEGSPLASGVVLAAMVFGLAGLAWWVHGRIEAPARRWLTHRRAATSPVAADTAVVAGVAGPAAPAAGLARLPV